MRETFRAEQTFVTPEDDWVPLDRAPFYYGRNFIRSAEEWRPVIEDVMSLFSTSGWMVDVRDDDDQAGRVAAISGAGLRLELYAARGEMWLLGPELPGEIFPEIYFYGPPDEFNHKLETATVEAEHEGAFAALRDIASSLCGNMRMNLSNALNSGAARLMARKRSPLELFSYIPVDQWHHFTPDPTAPDESLPWYAPIFYQKDTDAVLGRCTATSAGGDKLFSVHVAPGQVIRVDVSGDREKQCLHWLAGQMRQFPDSFPGGLRAASAAARRAFPGLSDRAFQRSYIRARELTGNKSWSRPGRPSKSLRLITSPE